MMDMLCKVCDRSLIENPSEYQHCLSTLRKKNDKGFFIKIYTINIIKLDEFKKILNDYITTHNKKLKFNLVIYEFQIEFDNNFIINIETIYIHKIESEKIKIYLLYYIDCLESRGYKVCNINQMTLNTINDICNMTYEYFIKQPMRMCERMINMNIAKNPQLINLLDRNKNHPLIRNFSDTPFNN